MPTRVLHPAQGIKYTCIIIKSGAERNVNLMKYKNNGAAIIDLVIPKPVRVFLGSLTPQMLRKPVTA